jgi:hypothetical protein
MSVVLEALALKWQKSAAEILKCHSVRFGRMKLMFVIAADFRVARFFLVQTYQSGIICQRSTLKTNGHKLGIPNGRKIFQMVKIYNNICHSRALQNLPKLRFLVRKKHLATLVDFRRTYPFITFFNSQGQKKCRHCLATNKTQQNSRIAK